MGVYHSTVEIDYNKMVEYYKKIIASGCCYAMLELGYFYDPNSPYYAKQIDDGHPLMVADETKSKNYYKLAMKYSKDTAVDVVIQQIGKMQTFLMMIEIGNPSKYIEDKINEMKRDSKISDILYRINVSKKYNIYQECSICMENKINIFNNCGHLSCVNCFEKSNKCPFCKKDVGNKVSGNPRPRSRSASPSSRRPSPRSRTPSPRRSDAENEEDAQEMLRRYPTRRVVGGRL